MSPYSPGKTQQPYDSNFYGRWSKPSLLSARRVVPIVLQYLQQNSLVDVGCGLGAWAEAFREFAKLKREALCEGEVPLSLVHPDYYVPRSIQARATHPSCPAANRWRSGQGRDPNLLTIFPICQAMGSANQKSAGVSWMTGASE